MASHSRVLGALLLLLLSVIAAGGQTCTNGMPLPCASITFSFTVPPGTSDTRTSAAVLDQNGILVRTLWGNVSYPPGSYTATWDGLLDGNVYVTSSTGNVNSSTILSITSGANPNIAIGQYMANPTNSPGINPGTIVTNVSGTTITMSQVAPQTKSGIVVEFYSPQRISGIPGNQYTIKLLMNNVKYHYDGHLFTTDKEWYQANKFQQNCWWYQGAPKITFAGSNGWVACGYNEGAVNFMTFVKSNPNNPTRGFIAAGSPNNTETDDIATDNHWVYMMNGALGTGSYVTAVDANTLTPVFFSQGTYTFNTVWYSITATYIDFQSGSSNPPSGIAVERNSSTCVYPTCGNLLAIGHGSQNYIAFFDKITGASLGTVSTGTVYSRSMAFTSEGLWYCGSDGNLYLVTGLTTAIARAARRTERREDHRGRDLPAPRITPVISQPITGFSHVAGIGANTLNNTLYVADGGTNQQIYGYAPNTHTKIRTYGTAGGYNDCNPTVTHDRLMLDAWATLGIYLNPSYTRYAFIAADDDDHLWIGDQEGQRILHIDNNNNYVDQILYLRPQYYVAVSETMPTRVFGRNFLEYDVDYSKTLQPGDPDPALGGNSSWILAKNWQVCAIGAHGSPLINGQDQYYFLAVEQLSNGRVYAEMGSHGNSTYGSNYRYIFELPTNGTSPARNTGYSAPYSAIMLRNGNLRQVSSAGSAPSKTTSISDNILTGFDSNNNPIYNSGGTVASVTTNSSNALLFNNNSGVLFGSDTSTNGYFPVFRIDTNSIFRYPHAGAFKTGSSSYLWQTLPETWVGPVPDYKGGFAQYGPTGSAGGNQGMLPVRTEGQNFIFSYLSNYYTPGAQFYHYWEDGLMVGQFGNNQNFPGAFATPPYLQGYPVRPGNFGNASIFASTSYNGDIYVYVGDEAYAAAHRWHVSNLSSIHEYSGTTVLQPNGSVALTQVF